MPNHSVCVWFQARICQKALFGYARATFQKLNTSPIISSITRPRKASTATLRGGTATAAGLIDRV